MRFFVGIIGLLLFCSSGIAYAQSDSASFFIRVFGGGDSTPPTTPTLISATPVGPTQIDILWTASVDDFSVGGYVVRRDGVPIATTTLTSYADTGLAPSTTYAYEVQAFDPAFNYSSTSNSISTTTPDVPVPPPPDPVATSTPSQGTVARVVAQHITITPSYTTTSIAIETTYPSRIEIRWGRTASYELGYSETDALRRQHQTVITELEPGTLYEYEIIGYTPSGARTVLERGQFRTLSVFDSMPPPNVLRFMAAAEGANVRLSWLMPNVPGIAKVRIVRSHLGFPQHPQDGAVVYQGMGTGVLDAGVLAQYSPAYYTAFVYDANGAVSSGAVSVVYATTLPDRGGAVIETPVGQVPLGEQETPSSTLPEDTLVPQPFSIIISQPDRRFTFADNSITLRPDAVVLISIDAASVSSYLKTIIVRLPDPTDQRIIHSFLLRLNKDQTAYEAVIPPLGVSGGSTLFVDLYDLENYIVTNYHRPVLFVAETDRGGNVTAWSTLSTLWLLLGMMSIVCIFLLIVVLRRRGEDNSG